MKTGDAKSPVTPESSDAVDFPIGAPRAPVAWLTATAAAHIAGLASALRPVPAS